ncbi:MAG: LacI family DNA-binding transcriptional regulator [Solirubrobacteraceae bacterium]
MASLADIAERAGVSIATASRVLNGSRHPVSAPMRKLVLDAAAELGYSPSPVAQALVTRTSRILGVIVGDIVDPYFAEIARGVEDVAGRRGHLTMVCSAERSTAAELGHLRALCEYRAAGIVFASSGYEEDRLDLELARAVRDARDSGTAVVALARRNFGGLTATVDNQGCAHAVTAHLIDLGHTEITFVQGPVGLHTSAQRQAGFRAAMAAAGLDGDRLVPGGFEYESGYQVALRMMASGSLPQAIVAANDEVAIGILMSLRQAAIAVPGRVSVAGIDDTRPARYLDLTTVRVPLYELGALGAHMLLGDEAGSVAASPTSTVLAHRLMARATTGPPGRVGG